MRLSYYIKSYGWFYALIKRPFDSLIVVPFEKITNIIRWIPILWRDKNWNGSTDLLRIIDFKIAQMERCVRDDTWHSDTSEKIKEIEIARGCLERLIDGNYCKIGWEKHNTKYGVLRSVAAHSGVGALNGEISTSKPNFFPNSKAARASMDKLWKLEEKRRSDDYDKLFSILKENSGGWWT